MFLEYNKNEEKELLRGKLAGFFNKKPIVLTTKRLIIGEQNEQRSIFLDKILEVYAEQERLVSLLVVRLVDGTTEKFKLVAEKGVSGLTSGVAMFSGDMSGMESELRAGSKATVDRWVNLINRVLSSTPIS